MGYVDIHVHTINKEKKKKHKIILFLWWMVGVGVECNCVMKFNNEGSEERTQHIVVVNSKVKVKKRAKRN